jgi:hypothetical protein
MKRVVGSVERGRDENINCRVNEEEREKGKTSFLRRKICYLFIMLGFFVVFIKPFHLCWMVLLPTPAPCCLAVSASTERGVGSHDIGTRNL